MIVESKKHGEHPSWLEVGCCVAGGKEGRNDKKTYSPDQPPMHILSALSKLGVVWAEVGLDLLLTLFWLWQSSLGSCLLINHTLGERAARTGWLSALFVQNRVLGGTIPHPWTLPATPPLDALVRSPPPLAHCRDPWIEGPTPCLHLAGTVHRAVALANQHGRRRSAARCLGLVRGGLADSREITCTMKSLVELCVITHDATVRPFWILVSVRALIVEAMGAASV
mmetsp:Transcript_12103/g.18240  ORF Transcript_12103/g.18240 Transcript_12103/m.18240 type:complete len:225 (+) Transcript_12103:202-876(+)